MTNKIGSDTNSSTYVPPNRSPAQPRDVTKINEAFKRFREMMEEKGGKVKIDSPPNKEEIDEGPPKKKVKYDTATLLSSNPTSLEPGQASSANTQQNLDDLQETQILQPDSTHSSSSKIWQPPPTPRPPKSRSKLTGIIPQPSPYMICIRNADNGFLVINDKKVSVTLLSKQGKYKRVYRIKEGQSQIIEGKPNANLVVKIYNQKWAVAAAKVKGFIQYSLTNYQEAIDAGVPVATIYQCAHCIVQEYVPGVVDLDNPDHMNQVRNLFLKSQEKNIHLDLYPDNLRVRKTEKGDEVVLIDFFEENQTDVDVEVHETIQQRIITWCQYFVEKKQADREVADRFLKEFTAGFEKYGYTQEEHKLNLDRIFERGLLPEVLLELNS